MNAESILNLLMNQVALEDPMQLEDNPVSALAPPLDELICRTVAETVAALGNEPDEDEMRTVICAILSRTATAITHAATTLWQSAVIESVGSDLSPLIPVVTPAKARAGYKAYRTALRRLADVISRTGLDPLRLPVMKEVAEELKSLPPVFAFLAERRTQLRKLVHPGVCQYTGGHSCAEMGADRGDEIASFYHTIILRAVLAEEPENWTLRDKPEYLDETLVCLLGDLHHLADAAEIPWRDLLARANKSYESEREEGA